MSSASSHWTLLLSALMALGLATVGYPQTVPPPSDIDPTINPSSDAETTDAQKAAALNLMMDWVESTLGPQLGMDNPRQEWTATTIVKDTMNIWHFRLSQVFQGIPVKDGQLSIHVQEGASEPAYWHGDYMVDPQVDTEPKMNKQRAINIVEAMIRGMVQKRGGGKPANVGQDRPDERLLVDRDRAESRASLEIHPGNGPGKRKLTYHVSVSHSVDIEMEAWVDQDGGIVEAYNNAQAATCDSGSGYTFYQGYQSYFKVAYAPSYGGYVLNDNCSRIGTYDMYETDSSIYQAVSGSSGFGNYFLRPCGSGDRNTSNADAHRATAQSYSFMYYVLGRNFCDGAGGPRVKASVDGLGPLITVRNHAALSADNGNNAFYDFMKKWVSIGNGDCSRFRSLATLDIIAHEWTHGLTYFTVTGLACNGLTYFGESGALNESFSDIFGAMTERYWKGESANTWKIGEEAFTPATAGDALRYMNNPGLGGQPSDYPHRYAGTGDNGGVHINSGIMNFAFYLLSKGGCGTYGCVAGINADNATRIFWRALRYYTACNDNFSRVRRTTQQAAADLFGYGSNAYNQTVNAWVAVGVP